MGDYDNLAKIDNANSNMDNNNLQESNASKIEDWEKKEHEWIENVQSDLNHTQPALPQREYTHTHAQSPFQQPSQLHHSPPTLPQIEYTHTQPPSQLHHSPPTPPTLPPINHHLSLPPINHHLSLPPINH